MGLWKYEPQQSHSHILRDSVLGICHGLSSLTRDYLAYRVVVLSNTILFVWRVRIIKLSNIYENSFYATIV